MQKPQVGLEPTTLCLEGTRAIQLRYGGRFELSTHSSIYVQRGPWVETS